MVLEVFYMNKILKILAVFCLFFLTGCTANGSQGASAAASSSYEIGGKTYYNKEERYGNAEHSKVWFGKDGSFVLTDNFYDGSYEMQGTWSVKENVITLKVDKSGVGNYTSALFEISDENTIILKTMLAGSLSDDAFTTEKPVNTPATVTPVPDQTPAPDQTPEPDDEQFGYYNTDQDNPYGQSFVQFYDDGTFSFTEIQGLGAVQVNGRYGMEGNMLIFSNLDCDFYCWDGQKIYNFEMEVYDENTLILMEDLAESRRGDVFTISGTKPAGMDYTLKTEWTSYHGAVNGVPIQFPPTVVFDSNGEFDFTENCYAGMAHLKGTYVKNDIEYICTVTDASSMRGVKGADVKEIIFKIRDADTIVLSTEICMSEIGDEFRINK